MHKNSYGGVFQVFWAGVSGFSATKQRRTIVRKSSHFFQLKEDWQQTKTTSFAQLNNGKHFFTRQTLDFQSQNEYPNVEKGML